MPPRNPYLNRSMIRTVDAFFGRGRELGRTMARIGDHQPQSVSIVGDRRVGKSSFLWHLAQPEVAARYLDEPERTLFVYVDFQGQRHLDLAGFSQVLGRQLAGAASPQLQLETVADLTQLEARFQALSAAGLRVVGLFDEFETVTGSPAFGSEFFGFLRSLANSYPVAYVTASRRELQSLCRSQAISESPFFNIFTRVALGPLDLADAQRLIAEPSEAAGLPLAVHEAEILELGCCLPMFLQIACSAAFESVVETGSFDPGLMRRRFREEADAHLRYLWDHLSDDEREALRALLAGSADMPEAPVSAALEARGVVRLTKHGPVPFSSALGASLAEAGLLEAAPPPAPTASMPPNTGEAGPEVQAETPVMRLPPTPAEADPFPRIVGRSEALRRVFTFIQRAAASDVTVLLLGETGTGKELVTRTIHDHSDRAGGPFVVVNCGAIAEHLQESELFGHRKGAFTDAIADREGLFEVADGGTLLLDEIGEMSASTQVKLLRVLQEGEVRRVGDSTPRRVDVRVIGATNRDLEAEVAAGRFRADLYYRICVLVARLPPLRERRDDIPRLVDHFLGEGEVTPGAAGLLAAHDWPGNIRELENQLAAARAVAGTAPICPEHLWPRLQGLQPVATEPPPAVASGHDTGTLPTGDGTEDPPAGSRWDGMTLRQARDTFERELLAERLQQLNGDLSAAATSLSVSRSRLYELVRKHGLRSGD